MLNFLVPKLINCSISFTSVLGSSTAGQEYLRLKNSPGLDAFNQFIHSIPTNKFFLWFPGKKWNNQCAYGTMKGRKPITYVPDVTKRLVTDPRGADTLNLGNVEKPKPSIFNFYNITLVVILLLVITIIVFAFILKK